MLTGKHYRRMVFHQCECACEPSNVHAGCKCMNTPHIRKASRQCECACDASGFQLGCTCTHTYHTQTVARQCVSSHVYHTLISDCSDTSMQSSSTCARLPRVQCVEGREQTRTQRHLRGSTKQAYIISKGVLIDVCCRADACDQTLDLQRESNFEQLI